MVKVTIDILWLAEVIIDIIVQYDGLPNSIIINHKAIFISKFWSLLYYFSDIKRQFSTAIYFKTNGQTEQQNSTMEAYLHLFVNLEQNDGVQLLSMIEFVYNNSKNADTVHILFELNCDYHPWISFEDKCNVCSRSSSANRLIMELKKLINICCQNLLHAQDL